ncbi:MAG: PQQ-binding-like beta-propeller repeat protein, partial [Cellvibrionaceae bacterium]|nr:PQQ-binding-like beta-propeller repeat protein [Cellvibrionaceae bacterium]
NNKGVAIKGDKLYVGVVDGYLDAVDIATGKRIWRADTLVDRSKSYTVTGAPRIAGNNIVIGNGGSDMDARGYVTAYDLETGAMAWRFYTVPGDPKFGEEHPELELARKTWGDNSRWDLGGGGTVYDAMSYDPELNLVYIGTSNGVPHPTWLRDPSGGDNLFLSSIIAINADTGRMKWHYQTTPSDDWDFG